MSVSVKVVGLGHRQTFKDSNGKDVEFVPVAICYKDETIPAGFRAETIAVNPGKIPAELTVGEKISMELYRYKGRTRIRSIG